MIGLAEGAPKTQTKKAPQKRTAAKRKTKRRGAVTKSAPPARRPYPRVTLEQALRIPFALKEKNGGNPWPPAEVAAAVALSHKNPDFFYMAAASRDFGLTEGSRDSEQISLTEFGRGVVYPRSKEEEGAKLREALLNVEIFRKVLDHYKGSNLPEMQYLGNTLTREFKLDRSFHEEFSKLFKENCTFLKIGSGYVSDQVQTPQRTDAGKVHDSSSTVVLAEPTKETGLRCFAIMPFRERDGVHAAGFL